MELEVTCIAAAADGASGAVLLQCGAASSARVGLMPQICCWCYSSESNSQLAIEGSFGCGTPARMHPTGWGWVGGWMSATVSSAAGALSSNCRRPCPLLLLHHLVRPQSSAAAPAAPPRSPPQQHQYLFNAPEGFARLVLEHKVRPGGGLKALFIVDRSISSQVRCRRRATGVAACARALAYSQLKDTPSLHRHIGCCCGRGRGRPTACVAHLPPPRRLVPPCRPVCRRAPLASSCACARTGTRRCRSWAR
jgi:hypothetical protein